MDTYIQQRQNTIAQYIATRLLLGFCKSTERNQGARVGMQRVGKGRNLPGRGKEDRGGSSGGRQGWAGGVK